MLLAITLAVGQAQSASADVIGIGDSLTDTGRFFAATGIPPSPPYFQGRFTNGPVWVEAMANALGTNVGVNLAWNGARVIGPSPYGVPDMQTQAWQYVAGLGAGSPAPGDIFAVWGGANDLFFTGQVDPITPQQIAANLGTVIETLAGAGARTFVVPNVPDLGKTPFFAQATEVDVVALGQYLSFATPLFNAALAQELNQLESALGITIHQIDVYSLFEDAQANPGAYGLTNVTDAAAGFDPATGLATHLAPADVYSYLFIDGVHPTARGHEIVGNFAAAQVVPEPASLVVWLVLGAAGCGVARRRGLTKRPVAVAN
jgi:outer membrane lipase/esterase